MTIGIGLVCGSGKYILQCADTRASYEDATTNDQSAKFYELPSNYCLVGAGTLSQYTDIVAELHHRMSQITEPEIAPELVRKCILESYDQIYSPLADEALRNDPRISLEEYKHDKKLSIKIRQYAREVLKGLDVDVDLIVAGFYRGQPVQFVASGGTSVRIRSEIVPGNAVIGTGSFAALNWLNYRRQNIHLGLAQSLMHLTEAKQFSQTERTVGPLREAVLLWSGGFKPLDWTDDAQKTIQSWWNEWGLPLSDGLNSESENLSVFKLFGIAAP